jgi:hypothetical protein
MVLVWTRQMANEQPKSMTNEQKAFALLYGRSLPIAVLQENLGDGCAETMKMLYDTGYVSTFAPSDKSELRYELTTKGKKHYLASILPMDKKDDDTKPER